MDRPLRHLPLLPPPPDPEVLYLGHLRERTPAQGRLRHWQIQIEQLVATYFIGC